MENSLVTRVPQVAGDEREGEALPFIACLIFA
jgi:hypothetical protein